MSAVYLGEETHAEKLAIQPLADLLAKDYLQLADEANKHASMVGVTAGEFDAAMELLENVRMLDEDSALNCLRDVPRSLIIAAAVRNVVPEAPVNERLVCLAALTSDAGKAAYPGTFLRKSSEGKSWTDPDRRLMSGHPAASYHFVLGVGLPESLARIDGEHHSLQTRSRYGMGIPLSDEERVARDILAAADFAGAMLERENTANSMMDEAARLASIVDDLTLLFDHPIYAGRGARIVEEALALLTTCKPEEVPKSSAPDVSTWKAIGLMVIGDDGPATYTPQIRTFYEGDDMFTLESGKITDVRQAA